MNFNLSEKKPKVGQKVYTREDMFKYMKLIPEGTEFMVKDVNGRSVRLENDKHRLIIDLERSGIHFSSCK